MYQIAYIGRWETLPETAAAICDHDTPKLEALLQGGLDLDVPIQLSEYIKLMPLEIEMCIRDRGTGRGIYHLSPLRETYEVSGADPVGYGV